MSALKIKLSAHAELNGRMNDPSQVCDPNTKLEPGDEYLRMASAEPFSPGPDAELLENLFCPGNIQTKYLIWKSVCRLITHNRSDTEPRQKIMLQQGAELEAYPLDVGTPIGSRVSTRTFLKQSRRGYSYDYPCFLFPSDVCFAEPTMAAVHLLRG